MWEVILVASITAGLISGAAMAFIFRHTDDLEERVRWLENEVRK